MNFCVWSGKLRVLRNVHPDIELSNSPMGQWLELVSSRMT